MQLIEDTTTSNIIISTTFGFFTIFINVIQIPIECNLH